MKKLPLFCTGLLLAGSLAGCTAPAAPAAPAPTAAPTVTATPVPTATPAPTPTATPVPTPAALSEEEEKTELLAFWQDAQLSYWVSGLPDSPEADAHYNYYIVVSNYLEHHAERLGEPIVYDTDGAPCFPYEDFLGVAQAIFGDGIDYTAYIPNDPGPQPDVSRAIWGYGPGAQYAEPDPDSFVLQGDRITLQAAQTLQFPGEEPMSTATLTYTFAVQPDNEYCRYRLVSLEEAS